MSEQSNKAAVLLRIVYLISLVNIFVPRLAIGGLSAYGWVGVVAIGLAGWRFVYVVRHPDALASPPSHLVVTLIKGAGVTLMVVGILGSIGLLFFGSLIVEPGGFLLVLLLYSGSSKSLYGILLFELGKGIARFMGRRESLPQ